MRCRDEWGGSYEKRMRFPLEIVKSIREAVTTILRYYHFRLSMSI